MDIIEKVIEEIKEKTKKEYIKIIAQPYDNMTQFDSKFGGVPYIPNGFEYPYSRTNPEQPLKLLAQINFSKVPEIEDFKHLKGILQFYINPDGECYGADWNNCTSQNDFRIIYHKNIDLNADNTDKIPEIEFENGSFPVDVTSGLKLKFEKSYDNINDRMDCFDEIFSEICNKYSDKKITSIYDDFDGNEYNKIWESINDTWSHKIGGYPNYTQNDEQAEGYSVQLLQMDSEFDYGKSKILWGDKGVAHFFISEEKLKNFDFSDVFYTWDCY